MGASWREYTVFGFMIWLTFTTSGGWNQQILQTAMDKELGGRGQLWQLCEGQEITDTDGVDTCPKRTEYYGDLYTKGTLINAFIQPTFGAIMDPRKPFCGPKMSAVIGLGMLAAGYYLLGSINSDLDSLSTTKAKLLTGVVFVWSGVYGPLVSAVPMINFFNKKYFVWLLAAVQVGQFASGMSAPIGWFIMEKANVSIENRRKVYCMFFVIVTLVNLCIAWLIYPTRSIKPGDGDKINPLVDIALWRAKGKATTTDVEQTFLVDDKEEQVPAKPMHSKSLCGQIMSRQFVFLTLFMASFLISNTYIGGDAVAIFISRAPWMQTFWQVQANLTPALLLPVTSLIMDRGGYRGGIWATVLTNAGQLFPLLFKGAAAAVIALIPFSLNCVMPYTFFYTFISTEFGYANFGRISGFSLTLMGLISQFCLVLNSWADKHGFNGPTLLCGALLFVWLPATTKRGIKFIAPGKSKYVTHGDDYEEVAEVNVNDIFIVEGQLGEFRLPEDKLSQFWAWREGTGPDPRKKEMSLKI